MSTGVVLRNLTVKDRPKEEKGEGRLSAEEIVKGQAHDQIMALIYNCCAYLST
jgi:hypothetical protein